MNLIPVRSSNLAAVGFDPLTSTLYIRFRKTGLYEYFNVPESIYHGLMDAPSKGHYHATHIRGRYRYKHL